MTANGRPGRILGVSNGQDPAIPIGPQTVSRDGIQRYPLVVGNLTHPSFRISPSFSRRIDAAKHARAILKLVVGKLRAA